MVTAADREPPKPSNLEVTKSSRVTRQLTRAAQPRICAMVGPVWVTSTTAGGAGATCRRRYVNITPMITMPTRAAIRAIRNRDIKPPCRLQVGQDQQDDEHDDDDQDGHDTS